MMRLRSIRSWIGTAVVTASILATCQSARAQGDVGSNPDNDQTMKITVSGEIDIDYVYRGRELTGFTESFSRPLGSAPNPIGANSENTVEGFVEVRTDIELSDNISARVAFGTQRVDLNDANQPSINELGGESSQDPALRELAILLGEILTPGLSAELGIPNWSFNPGNNGGSLAFDPRRSQTFIRNIYSLGDPATEEVDDSRLGEAGFPNELDPIGGVVRYENDQWLFELVLLPGVIEGGSTSADESLYAFDGFYKLGPDGSRIGLIVALHGFQNNPITGAGDSGIITVGGGFSLNDLLMEGLQLYGEAYFQSGDAGQDGAGADVDAGGTAFQGGLEYRHVLGNPMPIWGGVKVTHYSGDGDANLGGDQDAERFASYESINDLLIIESMYYGFDVDSNYTAFKIYAGIGCSIVSENDLEISVIVGITNMSEDINFITSGGGAEDGLGNEFDVKASWSLTKQVVVDAAFAMLVGSDVLEESMGGATNPDAEDSVMMFTMGADLRF